MTSLLDLLSAPSRQSSVLDQTEHRPWPLLTGPWLMAQTWEDLLFAHWPVDAEVVRRLLPDGLSVDEREGAPGSRSLLSRSADYAYGAHGLYRGPRVSLDTSRRLAVEAARRLFRLPYYHARLRLERSGDRIECDNARRGGDRTHVFSASYAPAGDVFEPAHPPWRIRPAEASIKLNTMFPEKLDLPTVEPLCHFAEPQDVVIWPLESSDR